MKRFIVLVLSIIMIISMVPTSVFAQEDGETDEQVTVQQGEQDSTSDEEELQKDIAQDGPVETEEPQNGQPAEDTGVEQTVSSEEGDQPETADGEQPGDDEQTDEPAELTETPQASPVAVTFVCAQTEDLSGLEVRDAEKKIVEPVEDTETKEPVCGSYLLLPGDYTYSFTADGFEAIEKDKFTVKENVSEQEIELILTAAEPVGEEPDEEPAEPEEEPAENGSGEEESTEAVLEEGPELTVDELPLLAASYTVASGTCGTNLTWTLDEDGLLTISGTGAMDDYGFNTAPWNGYRESIKSAVILEGVTHIGGYAFIECSQMTSVNIATGVTSIGDYAFDVCTALTSIDLPNTVTTINTGAFDCCTGLLTFTVPEGVTRIEEYTFQGCTGLISVIFSDSVEFIGCEAFNDCGSLTSITIPSGVTSVDELAFENCSSLISIAVAADNAVYRAEGNCLMKGNELVIGCAASNIPNDTTSIGSCAFYGCKNLESIVIPNKVTSIGRCAFAQGQWISLESITIPRSVIDIGEHAFFDIIATVYYEDGLSEDIIGQNFGGNLTWMMISEKDIVASGTCGTNLTWTLNEDGLLTISGSGAMENYTQYSSVPWYSRREDIKHIEFSDGILNVADHAFGYCSNLLSVFIPNSIASIGDSAFCWCTSLTSISIPSSVTSIGDYAFNNCNVLSSVVMSERTSLIGKYAFRGCSAITTISIPDGVLRISDGAFSNCSNLTEIAIPSTVKNIGVSAFEGCSNLAAVSIADGVTSIGEKAFSNSGIKSIDIPNTIQFINSKCFYNCAELASVSIPSSVTGIGSDAFEQCINLSELIIPDSVISVGSHAFYGCCALQTLSLPANITGHAFQFYGCTGLKTIILTGTSEMPDYPDSTYYERTPWYYSRNNPLTVIIMPGITSIGDYAFYNCVGLTSISIPDSVATIGACSLYGCNRINELRMPAKIICTEDMFYQCSALTNVILTGNGEMAEYTYDTYHYTPWYQSRRNQICVEIAEGVKNVSDYAFYNCSGLTSIKIPDSVTSIGKHAFTGCRGLRSLTMPADMECTSGMFVNCTKLTNITLTGSGPMTDYTDQSYQYTPWYIAREKHPTITLTEGVTSIGEHAFDGCTGMEEMVLPEGVERISAYAFANCADLTRIVIPSTVTHIDANAFSGCTGLQEIIYNGTDWCAIEIGPGNGLLTAVEPVKAHPIDRIELFDPDGINISDGSPSVDLDISNTTTLTLAITPETDYKVKLTSSDESLATVDDAGNITFLAPGEVIITVTAQDGIGVSEKVTFRVYKGSEVLQLPYRYLLMEVGETKELEESAIPAFYEGWEMGIRSTDETVIIYDIDRVVAVGEGTAYLEAFLGTGKYLYKAYCRVDVTAAKEEEPEEISVRRVDLLTTSATVNVYATAHTKVGILPVIDQNLMNEKNSGKGVSAEHARFEEGYLDGTLMNTYFDLRVADDRTLEIVPKDNAVADALAANKALKSSMKGKIVVTMDGQDFVTAQQLTLSVKKTKPAVKATKIAFNSYKKGIENKLTFTGGKVLSIDSVSDLPGWIVLDTAGKTVSLSTADIPAKYTASGKFTLNCTVEGYAVPVSVAVSYTVKSTEPKMTFSVKNVTLKPGTLDRQTVTLQMSPWPFNDIETYPISVVRVEQQQGKEYVDSPFLLINLTGNKMTLRAPVMPADHAAHTYRVTLNCAGKSFTYTVKTLAYSTRTSITLKAGAGIHSMIPGSYATVTAALKNFHTGSGERYMVTGISEYAGKTYNGPADGLFDVTQNGAVFTFRVKEGKSLTPGCTYKATVGADPNGDGVADVTSQLAIKATIATKAPAVSVAATAKGSIDVVRAGTAITLTPSVKGVNYVPDQYELVFYRKVGMVTSIVDDPPFEWVYANGVFTLTAGDGLTAPTSEWTVAVKAKVNGTEYTSKAVKLSVKQVKVTVACSEKTVTLLKNDRFSRGVFKLSIADRTVGKITGVTLDDKSKFQYQLQDLDNGEYALEYLYNTLPATFKAGTVKLSVFTEGCDKAVATVSVKVSFK